MHYYIYHCHINKDLQKLFRLFLEDQLANVPFMACLSVKTVPQFYLIIATSRASSDGPGVKHCTSPRVPCSPCTKGCLDLGNPSTTAVPLPVGVWTAMPLWLTATVPASVV